MKDRKTERQKDRKTERQKKLRPNVGVKFIFANERQTDRDKLKENQTQRKRKEVLKGRHNR